MFRSVVTLLVLFGFGTLLPSLALSSVITLTSPVGADFSFINGKGGTGLPSQDGLAYKAQSTPDSVFSSSNPLAPVVLNVDSFVQVQTGPLVVSIDNSWTFEGGTFYRDDGTSVSTIPLPSGYQTCEAAGFSTDPFNTALCQLSPVITGTLGVTTFSLGSPVVLTGEDLTMQNFDFTGTVSFDITPDLALAEGISTGPYFGFFSVEGEYFTLPSTPGFINEQGGIHTTGYELVGATAPEPSALILLLPVLGWICLVSRRKT